MRDKNRNLSAKRIPWRGGFAGAVTAIVAVAATNASAYCRTTTCDPMTTECNADAGDCPTSGHPLHWPDACVSFSVNENGSPFRGVSYDEAQELTETAVSRWMNADCGGGQTPSLDVRTTGPALCDEAGFSLKSGNVNLVLFRDDDWPYSNDGAVLAFTTINYNRNNGQILDADIEINSEFSALTTSDNNIHDDLDSILTHELGHFFGLSHVLDEEATMFASYTPGESLKRTLNADDAAGICAIYPPHANGGQCNPVPYQGFDENCFPTVEDSGCTVSAPSPNSSAPWLLAAALGLGASLRRRRR